MLQSIVPFVSALTSSLIFSLSSGSVGSPFEEGIFGFDYVLLRRKNVGVWLVRTRDV